jgi:hypothetical protein
LFSYRLSLPMAHRGTDWEIKWTECRNLSIIMPGSDNEVLSPAEVRATVIEWAQSIVQSYAEP